MDESQNSMSKESMSGYNSGEYASVVCTSDTYIQGEVTCGRFWMSKQL
jgi:hypothetical protein